MVKPNRCSVSMVSVRALAGMNARASDRQDIAVRLPFAAETSHLDAFSAAMELPSARRLLPHCIQNRPTNCRDMRIGGTRSSLIILFSTDIAISRPKYRVRFGHGLPVHLASGQRRKFLASMAR